MLLAAAVLSTLVTVPTEAPERRASDMLAIFTKTVECDEQAPYSWIVLVSQGWSDTEIAEQADLMREAPSFLGVLGGGDDPVPCLLDFVARK